MYANLNLFQTAAAMARHAGHRQSIVARNIANADTPGYIARDIPSFQEMLAKSTSSAELRASRATHMHGAKDRFEWALQDGVVPTSDPNGNSVSLETEMVRGVEAQRQHNRALAIYKSSLTILRTTLGRR